MVDGRNGGRDALAGELAEIKATLNEMRAVQREHMELYRSLAGENLALFKENVAAHQATMATYKRMVRMLFPAAIVLFVVILLLTAVEFLP